MTGARQHDYKVVEQIVRYAEGQFTVEGRTPERILMPIDCDQVAVLRRFLDEYRITHETNLRIEAVIHRQCKRIEALERQITDSMGAEA